MRERHLLSCLLLLQIFSWGRSAGENNAGPRVVNAPIIIQAKSKVSRANDFNKSLDWIPPKKMAKPMMLLPPELQHAVSPDFSSVVGETHHLDTATNKIDISSTLFPMVMFSSKTKSDLLLTDSSPAREITESTNSEKSTSTSVTSTMMEELIPGHIPNADKLNETTTTSETTNMWTPLFSILETDATTTESANTNSGTESSSSPNIVSNQSNGEDVPVDSFMLFLQQFSVSTTEETSENNSVSLSSTENPSTKAKESQNDMSSSNATEAAAEEVEHHGRFARQASFENFKEAEEAFDQPDLMSGDEMRDSPGNVEDEDIVDHSERYTESSIRKKHTDPPKPRYNVHRPIAVEIHDEGLPKKPQTKKIITTSRPKSTGNRNGKLSEHTLHAGIRVMGTTGDDIRGGKDHVVSFEGDVSTTETPIPVGTPSPTVDFRKPNKDVTGVDLSGIPLYFQGAGSGIRRERPKGQTPLVFTPSVASLPMQSTEPSDLYSILTGMLKGIYTTNNPPATKKPIPNLLIPSLPLTSQTHIPDSDSENNQQHDQSQLNPLNTFYSKTYSPEKITTNFKDLNEDNKELYPAESSPEKVSAKKPEDGDYEYEYVYYYYDEDDPTNKTMVVKPAPAAKKGALLDAVSPGSIASNKAVPDIPTRFLDSSSRTNSFDEGLLPSATIDPELTADIFSVKGEMTSPVFNPFIQGPDSPVMFLGIHREAGLAETLSPNQVESMTLAERDPGLVTLYALSQALPHGGLGTPPLPVTYHPAGTLPGFSADGFFPGFGPFNPPTNDSDFPFDSIANGTHSDANGSKASRNDTVTLSNDDEFNERPAVRSTTTTTTTTKTTRRPTTTTTTTTAPTTTSATTTTAKSGKGRRPTKARTTTAAPTVTTVSHSPVRLPPRKNGRTTTATTTTEGDDSKATESSVTQKASRRTKAPARGSSRSRGTTTTTAPSSSSSTNGSSTAKPKKSRRKNGNKSGRKSRTTTTTTTTTESNGDADSTTASSIANKRPPSKLFPRRRGPTTTVPSPSEDEAEEGDEATAKAATTTKPTTTTASSTSSSSSSSSSGGSSSTSEQSSTTNDEDNAADDDDLNSSSTEPPKPIRFRPLRPALRTTTNKTPEPEEES